MELNLFLLIILLLQLSNLSSAVSISSPTGPLCNEREQVALLHLKQSLSLDDQTNCPNPNPHLLSWIVHNETNTTVGCCSWEGVTCEASSGHVIGLDLSYGCLLGPFNATNPIFQLPRLQQLNLAGNDFSQSQIPSGFGKFSMLNTLNLSQASFSGSIPQDILELSSLTSLDLSGNPFLHLPRHGLASIAHNMKDLTELSLSKVNISSVVPATFANLISLRMLHLKDCNLQDYFPVEIFLLPSLESLNLMFNPDLYGHLPEFPANRNSLIFLDLSFTSFHGELPRSIGNLISLQGLDVYHNNFSGSIPYTIGKLVNMNTLSLDYNQFSGSIPSSLMNLTSLTYMSLSYNTFNPSSSTSLSWVEKLTKLKTLNLGGASLYGPIPSSIAKLQQIENLCLNDNKLSGQIPSWVGNLLQLVNLLLQFNNLEGEFPSSIFSLKNLKVLSLSANNLSGTVDICMFHEQKNITYLELSYNHLSVVSNKFANFSLPNLEFLDLDSCNLREIPLFLQNQDMLNVLSLASNNLSGEIPAWFLNVSTKTMVSLVMSNNFLTRFEKPVAFLPWSKLELLDLSYNSLVLINNKLGDAIPEYLGNSLQVLHLAGNKIEGKIPQILSDKCSLRWINLSQNKLKGKLPRTLAKCRDLESLDVGNNHITDTFPSWLGNLPKLQVLILKMNNFHGPIGSPSSMADFPELRIIDLSSNALTGALPSEYFLVWKGMSIITEKHMEYLSVLLNLTYNIVDVATNVSMSTDIMNKGMEREYDELSNIMVYISFSDNKFVGEIPESIGTLGILVGLGLSNNNLNGSIPSSLGELKQLESLDLSFNMLTGEIPQQLSQLTFLEYLNVSYNNLNGTIPGGGQFGTFESNSFKGNPGLCGLPLPRRCGGANEPSTTDEGRDHDGSSDHSMLVLGFEGFATGLAIGLGIGYIITTRNHQWFVKICLKLRYRK